MVARRVYLLSVIEKRKQSCYLQLIYIELEGTARDVSLIIDYIDAYIFPTSDQKINTNIALGVSLGGHSTWSLAFHEPRITSALIFIGCPDYINLMVDRARLSKIPSWLCTSPPGSRILGSEAFPNSFVETVRRLDPAGLLLGRVDDPVAQGPMRDSPIRDPTEAEQKALRPLLNQCLAGKKLLILSGGADKLVPYHRGEPFLTWMKKAISPGGWFADGGITLEDIIFEGVGHEVTPPMIEQAIRFIGESLSAGEGSETPQSRVRTSKM